MRRCLACSEVFQSAVAVARCPRCGDGPRLVAGFEAHAPDIAAGDGGFDPEHFGALSRLEGSCFWFRARNDLILWALETYAPSFESFLEIGCGTGFVLAAVAERFPDRVCAGSDIFADGLAHAARRVPGVRLMQMDARRIPFQDEYDVIGAFDVLEHIDDDGEVLRQIHGALRPEGLVVLTVPQHRGLWSSADDMARHVRRYDAAELRRKVTHAGFAVLRSTSFVAFLAPALFLARRLRGLGASTTSVEGELSLPWALDAVLYQVMRMERFLTGRGWDFPVGGSRLVVARKVN